MKLVREHIILEKFIEDSDPIADLRIGGFSLSQYIGEIMLKFELKHDLNQIKDKPEIIEYWKNLLESTFIGRQATGVFARGNANGFGSFIKCITSKIIRIELFFDDPISIEDNLSVLDFALIAIEKNAWRSYYKNDDNEINRVKSDEVWYYYSFGDMFRNNTHVKYTPEEKYTIYIK